MDKLDKYNFSFTAASLRLNDLRLVAIHKSNNTNIDSARELGNGKSSTGKRILSELIKRLSFLTQGEIDILINGDLTSQKQIAFLAVCKTHAFIRDFVIEVLRDKFLMFDYQITNGDYLSFYRRKNELHLEMDNLTEITLNKIRQVTFKILEQAGIIDSVKNKILQVQILDEKLISTIAKDNKIWLKLFFISDIDIKNISN